MNVIIRRNPIRDMAAMQSAMDRMFEEAWRGFQPGSDNADRTLALDVHEADDRYTVVATLPGLSADDVNITLHEGALNITATLPQPEVAEGTRVLMQERAYGSFSRTINLPQPVDPDNVAANYDNGILTLTLHKAAHAQPRQIKVQSGNLIRSAN